MDAYSSVRGLWSAVRWYVSQLHWPLIVELLHEEREDINQDFSVPISKQREQIQNGAHFKTVTKQQYALAYYTLVTNLLFGHVQEAHRVSFTIEVDSHSVQSFVELSLNVCQLFKHFAGRPQKYLVKQMEKNESFSFGKLL